MERLSESEKHKVRFKVELHRSGSPGNGEEIEGKSGDKSAEDECFVHIDSSSNLSSLASKCLQQLYEQGRVEGQDILKASNVKVLIQVRPTWKPLPLSSFVYKQSESDLSLETVFGPLLHVEDSNMVVHLHLCTDKIWTDDSVREVVKKLLQKYSQTQLERMNCPFSQGMLSQISRDQYYCKVTAEKIRLFGIWHDALMHSNTKDMGEDDEIPSRHGSCLVQRSKKIVFSPKKELPILRASFEAQSHPSTQKMSELADELNKNEFRATHGREKVDIRHVNNWFKNERARVRKLNPEHSQVAYRTEYSKPESGTEDEDVQLAIESEENGIKRSPVF
ncbi:uncharacterized protein LOC114517934 [Dendronephthya gigantea]|uniref:uncharacterized protein LOC114517934 n=1 Tax=Dendronephthya gigantea TaxID=151771 RepID=UPI00106AD830|nr:uncharacterized protein LOC114517934 [Dendronephthya gigantea]